MSTGNSVHIDFGWMGKLDDVARARIRAWFKGSGRTQADVAADIGRNQAWMSRYLDGEFDADLDTLQRFAVAFDNSLGGLLGFTPSEIDAEALDLIHALRPEARALALSLLREWADPPGSRGRSRARRAASGEAPAAAKATTKQ